jgi:hypothetical protein
VIPARQTLRLSNWIKREQMGRNVTMQKWGFLANSRYLLHDRDTKFCPSFRRQVEAGRELICGNLHAGGDAVLSMPRQGIRAQAAGIRS